MHIFTAAKLHTLSQKFVTRWGYVADPLIFAANREVWNSWSEQDRKIVREAAVEAGKQEIALTRRGLTANDMSMIKEVEALGVKVTELSEGDKQAFKKVLQPVYEKWTKQIGPDLVKRAESAVAASRSKA